MPVEYNGLEYKPPEALPDRNWREPTPERKKLLALMSMMAIAMSGVVFFFLFLPEFIFPALLFLSLFLAAMVLLSATAAIAEEQEPCHYHQQEDEMIQMLVTGTVGTIGQAC